MRLEAFTPRVLFEAACILVSCVFIVVLWMIDLGVALWFQAIVSIMLLTVIVNSGVHLVRFYKFAARVLDELEVGATAPPADGDGE